MEIRCSQCGHLGVAAGAQVVAGGVGLECAECGFVNVVAMDDGATPAKTQASKAKEASEEKEAREAEKASMLDAVVERLIPESGDGVRCRKCAHLFMGGMQNCSRCGLDVIEGQRYDDGEAPWEQPPPGREEVHERAALLWASARERENPQEIANFVDFVLLHGLSDFGIRKLQHYLVDHEGDEAAIQGLRQLAANLEKEVQVVRTQAQSSAVAFSDDVQRLRRGLLIGTLIFWLVILFLLSAVFWDKF